MSASIVGAGSGGTFGATAVGEGGADVVSAIVVNSAVFFCSSSSSTASPLLAHFPLNAQIEVYSRFIMFGCCCCWLGGVGDAAWQRTVVAAGSRKENLSSTLRAKFPDEDDGETGCEEEDHRLPLLFSEVATVAVAAASPANCHKTGPLPLEPLDWVEAFISSLISRISGCSSMTRVRIPLM